VNLDNYKNQCLNILPYNQAEFNVQFSDIAQFYLSYHILQALRNYCIIKKPLYQRQEINVKIQFFTKRILRSEIVLSY